MRLLWMPLDANGIENHRKYMCMIIDYVRSSCLRINVVVYHNTIVLLLGLYHHLIFNFSSTDTTIFVMGLNLFYSSLHTIYKRGNVLMFCHEVPTCRRYVRCLRVQAVDLSTCLSCYVMPVIDASN